MSDGKNDGGAQNAAVILETRFLQNLSRHRLIPPGSSVLVAFSGGADSVFLLHMLARFAGRLGITVAACHLNHGLRGEESDADEAFASQAASALKVPFFSERLPVADEAAQKKISLEMAGRELRYRALKEAAERNGYGLIATAHHADDLAETFLMRLFKGTGPSGLLAIRPKSGNIIRPLLFLEKREIVRYLDSRGIPCRTDSSNADDAFERNFVRNRVLPLVEERFPSYREGIASLCRVLENEEQFFALEAAKLSPFFRNEGGCLFISKELYASGVHTALARRAVRAAIREQVDPGFHAAEKFLALMEEKASAREGNSLLFRSARVRLYSSYGFFIVQKDRKKFPNPGKYVTLTDGLILECGDTRLAARRVATAPAFNPKGGMAPAGECFIQLPPGAEIILRPRGDGDRLAIRGGHTRKLKDFFIDRKFSAPQRESALVLAGKGGTAVAAVYVPGFGFRVSETCYVKEGEPCWKMELMRR